MHEYLLRAFQMEVISQCEHVLIAAKLVSSGLQAGGEGHAQLWFGVQSLVVAAANISKLCWGYKPEDRKALRDSLELDDSSPLKLTKTFRNHFEHLDERLDDWWRQSPHRNIVVDMVAPAGMQISNDPSMFGPKDTFRRLDPDTGIAGFWTDELSLPDVIAEVRRILPIAERESRKMGH